VKPLASNMNPLSVTQIAALVADHITDPKAALAFIESQEDVAKDDLQTYLVWKCRRVLQTQKCGDTEKAKEFLDAAAEEIGKSINLDAIVHSYYHQAAAGVYQAIGNPSKFFKSALLYLSYTPITQIPEKARPQFAYEIGVSAIVSADEFNFGELLLQPLMKECLSGSEYAWLWDLLAAFAGGKISDYEKVMAANKAKIDASQDLKAARDSQPSLMRQKITLLSLVDMVFDQPDDHKKTGTFSFDQVAKHCRVGVTDVETMVMRAFAMGLCKGCIDEVEKTCSISWLKPRVLNAAGQEVMRDRLTRWAGQADVLLKELEDLTPELLVS